MTRLWDVDPSDALELSRMADHAGYWPVKAKRPATVFRWLPVWYWGDPFPPRRAEYQPRRAKL